jgi:predicted amidophosphoribosyltransferase
MSTPSNLAACADCGGTVSKYAEACPHCGRFFKSWRSTSEAIPVTPGNGWGRAIAWGLWVFVLSNLILAAIPIVIMFLLGLGILGLGAAAKP